jgi:hypothetical protein
VSNAQHCGHPDSRQVLQGSGDWVGLCRKPLNRFGKIRAENIRAIPPDTLGHAP